MRFIVFGLTLLAGLVLSGCSGDSLSGTYSNQAGDKVAYTFHDDGTVTIKDDVTGKSVTKSYSLVKDHHKLYVFDARNQNDKTIFSVNKDGSLSDKTLTLFPNTAG